MEKEEAFLKPEIKKEAAPEFQNEKVEVGKFVLEPVDREANKFHFLQNLTEWHHSCLGADNKIWEKELGGFSGEEKGVIGSFKKVLEKYPQLDEKGLVSIFETSASLEEKEKRLKEVVSPKDREIIEKSLSIIEKPFSQIWGKNEEKLLKARQEFIGKLGEFKTSGKREQLEKDLSTFFGSPQKPDKLKTFFLMRESGTGGTASRGMDAITLAGSGKMPELSVFYHELTHKLWETNHDYDKICDSALESIIGKPTASEFKKTGLSKKDLHKITREGVIGSFLPHGCLAEKYFPKSMPAPTEKIKKIIEDLLINKKDVELPTGEKMISGQILKDKEKTNMFFNTLLAVNLAPLSERYIKEGRGADKDYFQEAIKTISSSINRTKIF